MLSEIIGNEAVKERIVSLLKAGRLPHAVMLEGQRGTGRLTLAHAIAKALVCDSGNACGNCLNCKQAANRINPDVLVYYPGKPTLFSVDDVRKINDDAMIKPNQAGRKVMILCECEKMNSAAKSPNLRYFLHPVCGVAAPANSDNIFEGLFFFWPEGQSQFGQSLVYLRTDNTCSFT